MNLDGQFALNADEIRRFHEDGFVGPFRAIRSSEMVTVAAQIEEQVFADDNGPCPGKREQSRHMDCPVVQSIVTREEIVDRMASLYGPHLILWATYFFNKYPGGKEIPWHQDLNYWPLEPIINISAWIAIDEAKIENACVRMIPGSHKTVVPHIAAPSEMEFDEMADPSFFDANDAVPIELEPGEFVIFNEKTLHWSPKNESQKRRRGMTMRVTIPIVKIEHDDAPLHNGHAAMLLCGEDYMGFNRLMQTAEAG